MMTSCRVRTVTQLCWSGFLVATNCMFDLMPASQMALASATSLLCHLTCGLSRPKRKTVAAASRGSLASVRPAPSDSRGPSPPSMRHRRSGPASKGRSTGPGPRSRSETRSSDVTSAKTAPPARTAHAYRDALKEYTCKPRPTPIGLKLRRRGAWG
jgi:hypothetical protein